MIKPSMAVLISLLLVSAVLPQTSTDAPVDWTAYKIGDHKLSISFPKLPIRFSHSDWCNEKRTEYFTAYADEVVYTLMVVQREKPNFALSCTSSSKFGRETLNGRRAELEKNGAKLVAGEPTELWSNTTASRNSKVWIFDELKKSRWIELTVTGRGEFTKAEDFVRSLSHSPGSDILEVGDGSNQTLGDRGVDSNVTAPSPTPKAPRDSNEKQDGSEPLTIIWKVKAQYTDAARRNGEKGTVTLRVSFLANGGIGSIQVNQGLKYGLTEQAIAAAKKMVFLPQRFKGITVTTSRPVSFTFNIY